MKAWLSDKLIIYSLSCSEQIEEMEAIDSVTQPPNNKPKNGPQLNLKGAKNTKVSNVNLGPTNSTN